MLFSAVCSCRVFVVLKEFYFVSFIGFVNVNVGICF